MLNMSEPPQCPPPRTFIFPPPYSAASASSISHEVSTFHTYPFLAPVKKNLTINTCNPAIATIIPLSMMLKLKIRFSVLRTVLKFRFSRVRKYFWFREMVDSWPETLKIDSSKADVCSGVVPCFCGRDAERDSPSTCILEKVDQHTRVSSWRMRWRIGERSAYGKLEIHHLVRHGAHIVVEAGSVISRIGGREHEVALPLLSPLHDHPVVGADNLVIDIEGAARLNL